jgi:hypothetical protein
VISDDRKVQRVHTVAVDQQPTRFHLLCRVHIPPSHKQLCDVVTCSCRRLPSTTAVDYPTSDFYTVCKRRSGWSLDQTRVCEQWRLHHRSRLSAALGAALVGAPRCAWRTADRLHLPAHRITDTAHWSPPLSSSPTSPPPRRLGGADGTIQLTDGTPA